MNRDDRLRWFREQRDKALDDVLRADAGLVEHFNIEDGQRTNITAAWRSEQQNIADRMERLIAAYEGEGS